MKRTNGRAFFIQCMKITYWSLHTSRFDYFRKKNWSSDHKNIMFGGRGKQKSSPYTPVQHATLVCGHATHRRGVSVSGAFATNAEDRGSIPGHNRWDYGSSKNRYSDGMTTLDQRWRTVVPLDHNRLWVQNVGPTFGQPQHVLYMKIEKRYLLICWR